VSQITWRLYADDAARLARILGEVIEYEGVDDDDLADVERYVSELLGLLEQRRRYDESLQPSLGIFSPREATGSGGR